MLALVEPGDEVIAFEPYYDSYAANIAMAGGVRVPVTLRPPGFRPDLNELTKAITAKTRLILLNSPHNPTGTVFDRDELAAIAALAVEHDLLVVTDEVYEHLAFDVEHVPIVQFPGCASGRCRSARRARRSPSPAGRSAGSRPCPSWSPR